MLTNEQLAQLETRLLEQLHGEDGDLAVLLAHIAQLTNHNRVMQVALAQLSDKENWFMLSDNQDKDYPAWYCDAIDPVELAEVALVNAGETTVER